MAVFCTNCGKELADSATFCPECGTRVKTQSENAASGAPNAPAVPSAPAAQTNGTGGGTAGAAYSQTASGRGAAQSPCVQNTVPASNTAVSTATFFWLDLLFAIPFAGLIACVIMAFVPENETLKHFARAKLIWAIVAIVIAVIVAVVLFALGLSIGDWIARGSLGNYHHY